MISEQVQYLFVSNRLFKLSLMPRIGHKSQDIKEGNNRRHSVDARAPPHKCH